jgi:hypothetical protein
MQRATHNCTTIRVADTTEISGRLAADETNLDRFYNRIGKVCALVATTLIVPALAYAQGKSPIAALQDQVTALTATVTALQTQVNSLQTQLATVQANPALGLGPYVSVDANSENGVTGPNIKFTGANIHILSGSGRTDDNLPNGGSLTGLGNLIIGYDGLDPLQVPSRGGSHNLVVGDTHSFTSSAYGGLVAGLHNTIDGAYNTVTGGESNTSSGFASSVTGGTGNYSTSNSSSVSGGSGNTASFDNAIVTGGEFNNANAPQAVVIGGESNTASSNDSIRPTPPFP